MIADLTPEIDSGRLTAISTGPCIFSDDFGPAF
jgi:hypothetical protein